MKRLLVIGLLLSVCLVACNKTTETTEPTEVVENTESEVLLVPDEVEQTEEPTLEEQLGLEPIEGLELVGIEIDGEEISFEEAQALKESVTSPDIDGGENIKIEEIESKAIDTEFLKSLNVIDPENISNPVKVLFPEELKTYYDMIDDERKDNVLTVKDMSAALSFRSFMPELVSNPDDVESITTVYAPITESDNITFTVLGETGIYEVKGTYKELFNNTLYASKVFCSFRIEAHDNVYEAYGPMSEEHFTTKYKPYATHVKTDFAEYYVLKNNVDGCKGSLTMFFKLDDGTVLPYSFGSKVEPLADDIDLQSCCDFLVSFINTKAYGYQVTQPYYGF